MSGWLIYLWTRLDPILTASVITSVISGMLSAISSFCYGIEVSSYGADTDDAKFCKFILKKCLPVFIMSVTLWVFVPCQKDAAMIYVVPKMAQSETFNAISKETPEITKLALEALKETLQGMTKKEESK